MIVTGRTLWSEVEPQYDLLTDESKAELIAMSCRLHGVEDFYLMTIAEFASIAEGRVEFLNVKNDGTALDTIFVKELSSFVETFTQTLASYQLPQSEDERAASRKLASCTFAEGLLIFARNYFGLQSFKCAEMITLGELLIAKKDAYNTALFNKEYNKQIAKK